MIIWFASAGGTVSVGDARTGTLTADLQFIFLFADTRIAGFFGVNIGLTSVVITPGATNLMNSWAGVGSDGKGGLTFSFANGPQTLSDLLTLGTPDSSYSNRQWDSLQGNITVPEPPQGGSREPRCWGWRSPAASPDVRAGKMQHDAPSHDGSDGGPVCANFCIPERQT